MTERICKSQSDVDAAIAGNDTILLDGEIYVSVSVDCRIICRSGEPHVVAWGSSQPHVEAWESSQPHVEARGSSQPHVVAWGSSQPHVVAKGSCQVSVRGRVRVTAAAMVAVLAMGALPVVDGGGFVRLVDLSTANAWCEYYGLDSEDGVVVLYKAVHDNWIPTHQIAYVPGTTPSAPDWDGGKAECGGGLHFSPSPIHALEFCSDATRFVACPVRLDEIVTHPDGTYPQKVKAPRVCAPCWEVDRYGKRVEASS